MEQAFAGATASQRGADNAHKSKPFFNRQTAGTHKPLHPILDAMNITIDKHSTLLALHKARKRVFGKDREALIILMEQIATSGGKL